MHGRDCIIKNHPYVGSYAMKAIFVTTNEHKRREVQEILGFALERADLDLPEIQAIDPAEVAAEKASAAREALEARDRCVGWASLEKSCIRRPVSRW
jgi:Ham1 family